MISELKAGLLNLLQYSFSFLPQRIGDFFVPKLPIKNIQEDLLPMKNESDSLQEEKVKCRDGFSQLLQVYEDYLNKIINIENKVNNMIAFYDNERRVAEAALSNVTNMRLSCAPDIILDFATRESITLNLSMEAEKFKEEIEVAKENRQNHQQIIEVLRVLIGTYRWHTYKLKQEICNLDKGTCCTKEEFDKLITSYTTTFNEATRVNPFISTSPSDFLVTHATDNPLHESVNDLQHLV